MPSQTDKQAISDWLMETQDFELSEGAEFHLKTTPRGAFTGILDCKVLSIDAPSTLVYSWKSNGMKEPTIVIWHLKPLSANETLLSLSHNGFVGLEGWMTKVMLSFGWKRLLKKKLSEYLAQ